MGDRRKPSRLGIESVLESLGLWRVEGLYLVGSGVVGRLSDAIFRRRNPPPLQVIFLSCPFVIYIMILTFFFLERGCIHTSSVFELWSSL